LRCPLPPPPPQSFIMTSGSDFFFKSNPFIVCCLRTSVTRSRSNDVVEIVVTSWGNTGTKSFIFPSIRCIILPSSNRKHVEDACNLMYPSYSAPRLRSDTCCCVRGSCKLHLKPVTLFSHIYRVFNLKSGPYFNMSNLFTKIYNMLYYATNLYLQ
jgi:hypothetical protein